MCSNWIRLCTVLPGGRCEPFPVVRGRKINWISVKVVLVIAFNKANRWGKFCDHRFVVDDWCGTNYFPIFL